MSSSRVILVSNRLPVHVTEEAGKLVLNRSIGGLATALSSIIGKRPVLWVGWAETRQKLSKKQLALLHFPNYLIPVAISPRLLNRYYHRLANGVLWPIMHGIKPARLDQEADWQATREVTTRFTNAIEEHCQADDIIWVHDYHLVLLPQQLRERGLKNRIGFFLHTPFPPPAVFMKWRHHLALLQSLSRVDVLGFQTQRDVKHFRACCTAAGISMRRRAVIAAFPIGVDFKAYRSALKLRGVSSYLQGIRRKVTSKKVILSVSRLDYTKGIIEQLHAVEKALSLYSPGSVLYKLVVAPSREGLSEYQKLRDEIDSVVRDINRVYKKMHKVLPIAFEYRSYGFEELNAWYRMADVLLVTPRIDGMNLIAKEYIAAHDGYSGAVVLSKTVGAAEQLKEAVQVDPNDVDSVTDGLLYALSMPAGERKRRWQQLRHIVKKEDVFWWAESFIRVLSGETQRGA
ncbi:MAG TPA: trehalose-6-phosphate synthase [Candidatus Saccharimonadales bacterium]|nr:trehalose-6-phosphate synthase [Candidatus Saccharimonadales bacterium]